MFDWFNSGVKMPKMPKMLKMLKTEIDKHYTKDQPAMFDRDVDVAVGCISDGNCETRIFGNRVFVPHNPAKPKEERDQLIQALVETIQDVNPDKDLMLVRCHWNDGRWGAIVSIDGALSGE